VSRLLGVDFGSVRVGLAISDPDRKIASPLATYARRSKEQDAQFFQRLVEVEEIAAIVVGLPIHCDGREGQKAGEARAYGQWLYETTGRPIAFWDERFTTVEAEGYLLEAGLTQKRRKERRDRVAAQIMLQAYLDEAGCQSTNPNPGRLASCPAVVKPMYTVDEYLQMERAALERHQYLDGQIYLMTGESLEHGEITMNLAGLFHGQLKGTPCKGLTKGTKIRSGPSLLAGETTRVLFTYPDIVVICGEPECLDAHTDVVLNPIGIAEVLSPSSEALDRGEKLTRYQTWNPTLKEYLLVSQDKAQIEHFSRQADGSWSYHRYSGLDSAVSIPSIGCTLKLADVYDRVDMA
jgi:putative transcription antitermination factor YqgF